MVSLVVAVDVELVVAVDVNEVVPEMVPVVETVLVWLELGVVVALVL